MTDFGGSGHSGAVAECELNDAPQLASGSATLTTSDLNELGCSLSASPLRLESADSGFAPSRTTSTNGDSVIEQKIDNTPPQQPTVKNKSRRRGNPSKHIVRSIIASITSGFSNCSRRKNGQAPPPGGGDNHPPPRRHSDSEEDSNSADLFEGNFKTNTKTRNISRDGAGFVVGSEATSTGYVSDSVDGYDKYKGLESEHGGSHGDSSLSYGEKQQKPVEPVCLETSVTQSLSPKLNLNIQYDDEEEEEVADDNQCPISEVKEQPEIEETEQVELEPPASAQPVEKSLVYVEDSDETEEESSEESDSTGDSNTQSGTNSGNGTSIEYTISNRSDSDISEEESTSYYVDRPVRLDVIVEDDEISEETPPDKPPSQVAIVKKKMSVKRKRSSRLRSSGSTTEQDLKNGMKSKLASLRKDLKKEDNRAHSSSLKDMIVQFETAVAALEMSERQVTQHVDDSDDDDEPHHEPALLGVKAIAQKIQAQTKAVDEGFDCAQMPPSQILKLKQALDLDEEKLSKPVPLSRRSESKVKLIAKQLAEAEKRRIQMEKLAKSQMCKSPKDIKKAASTSFINELLAMAKAEESVDRTNEPSSKVEEPHDFKQSLLAARKKITHREEEVAAEKRKTPKTDKNIKETPTKQDLPKVVEEPNAPEEAKVECQVPEEAVDPFVREVLCSKTVPEPVKQKIRIECWSLFNDPRTPKGVKQCILATMLSKVQNE